MLAQLVKVSLGLANNKRFKPHLGHNRLSCGVFFVKSRQLIFFWLPLTQTIMTKLTVSLSVWLSRYTNMQYLQSLPEETRTVTVQVQAGFSSWFILKGVSVQ